MYNARDSQQCKMVKRLRGFVTLCYRINSFSSIRDVLLAAKFPPTFTIAVPSSLSAYASSIKGETHSARVRHRNFDNLERGASKLRVEKHCLESRKR